MLQLLTRLDEHAAHCRKVQSENEDKGLNNTADIFRIMANCHEADADLLRGVLSTPSHARQNVYWMIKRNSKHKNMPPNESVMWFKEKLRFARGDDDIWTPHADKARRFTTKAAAEEYVRDSLTDPELYDPAPDVTDHMDCNGPTHAEIDASAASTTRQKLSDLVPTSWLDPLLSGPAAVFKPLTPRGSYHGDDIERLLQAVKARIQNAESALSAIACSADAKDAERYAARRRTIFETRLRLQVGGPRPSWDEFVKEYDEACDKEAAVRRAGGDA